MKRLFSITLFISAICLQAMADGYSIPFFRNVTSVEYGAHNRNYDVACDDYGTVFVANFEGLIYYDGARWRKIHTPGISRVTCLAKDSNGRIWVGGFDVFGYLTTDKQGRIKLKTIVSDLKERTMSEVDFIKITSKTIYVHTSSGKTFHVVEEAGKDGKKEEKLVPVKSNMSNMFEVAADSINRLKLPNGTRMIYEHGKGIELSNRQNTWAPLTEDDGLISNAVNRLTFDKRREVWGVTDRGLFVIDAITPYGQLTEYQGLKGEVNCIGQIASTLYFGTMEGLYAMRGKQIIPVKEIDLACWQFLRVTADKMLAATTNGLFMVTTAGVTPITDANTFVVATDDSFQGYITGEIDGIYRTGHNGQRTRIAPIEKVMKITLQSGIIKAETLYGELWELSVNGSAKPRCLRRSHDQRAPKLSLTDNFGISWTTDTEGRNLTTTSKSESAKIISPWLHPVKHKAINAIFTGSDSKVWIGGDFGAISIDVEIARKIAINRNERPYIREIIAMEDSVIWGGYDGNKLMPRYEITDLSLPSECKRIIVTFSTPDHSVIYPTLYRYRINGGKWTQWNDETQVRFNNITYGHTRLEIQAMDIFGRVSETSSVEWDVAYPFYMRWWANIIYLIVLVLGIMLFMRWRTKRLEAEKQKLEAIVAERTAELSETLDDLKRTQDNLVRMERTATAGKLTQGLIDRILNPINYINNFSRLTTGLARDLREDIEDEQDNMSEDNYEDCEDILNMMTQNLQKIEEHGINTTRTLRAMEAMLNNRIGQTRVQDIIPLCRQVVSVTAEYHKKEIEECGIKIAAQLPETPVMVDIDAESMNRILISLLTNSVYAVTKKYNYAKYEAEITLSVTNNDGYACIYVNDNGIGIEDAIKEKVFDPFFTTKTTGEAAGVGLYLVRELIHDHNGEITLESEKDKYCRFTIKLKQS